MKNILSMSAAALLFASTAAIAQAPAKGDGGPPAGNAGNAGGGADTPRGNSESAPSARENAPGQVKGDGPPAREGAPGQMKGERESARDQAGQNKDSKSSARDDSPRDDNPGKANRDAKADKEDAKKSNANTGASDGTAGSSTKGQGKNLAEIPAEKKSQVRSAFGKHRVEPAKDLNISVHVGVAVPRSVRLYSVPQDIVVIYPAYSSYRYFIVDDTICIVDPVTFEIVEVIIIA